MKKARGNYRLSERELAARAHRDAEITARWGARVGCASGEAYRAFRRDVKACTPEMWADILRLRRRMSDRRRHARISKNAELAAVRDDVRAADAEVLCKWSGRIGCEPGDEYAAFQKDVFESGASLEEWEYIKGLRRRLRARLALKRFRDRATAISAETPLAPESPVITDGGRIAPCPYCNATGFIDLH